MRDAEEVAREVWQAVADSIHRGDWSAVDAMAEVIRARDAEVRAATLAEVKQVVELHGFDEPEP